MDKHFHKNAVIDNWKIKEATFRFNLFTFDSGLWSKKDKLEFLINGGNV